MGRAARVRARPGSRRSERGPSDADSVRAEETRVINRVIYACLGNAHRERTQWSKVEGGTLRAGDGDVRLGLGVAWSGVRNEVS